MKRPTPRNTESPFRVDELFFSKTDARGVITDGNDVFVRVSQYAREDLLGKPHSLIRHPDMPRAVFRLLWDTIQSGHPIAAYVKNLAADGSYYWVLASVFPTAGGGYLSIRLKPTTATLPTVEAVYAKMLELEESGGMDASTDFLVEQLQGLGYSAYHQFAKDTLIAELTSRQQLSRNLERPTGATSVGTKVSPSARDLAQAARAVSEAGAVSSDFFSSVYECLDRIGALRTSLARSSKFIREYYQDIKNLSLNMAVESARIGDEGLALAVVSETFATWAEEMRGILGELSKSIDEMVAGLDSGSFNVAASRLQTEMMCFYAGETLQKVQNGQIAEEDTEKNRRNLLEFSVMAVEAVGSAKTNIEDLLTIGKAPQQHVAKLLGAAKALYIAQQTGLIEAARFASGRSFKTHLDEMGRFLTLVGEGTKSIDSDMRGLMDGLKKVHNLLESIAASLAPFPHPAVDRHAVKGLDTSR